MNSSNTTLNIGFCRWTGDSVLSMSDAELEKASSAFDLLGPKDILSERKRFLIRGSFDQGFKPFSISVESLKAHCYIGAGSGHGKSELIKRLAYGLMQQGYGVIILDPHGQLALQVAKWPEFSQNPDRLIYFAPKLASKTFSIAPVINPLAPLYQADDLDSVVENFMSMMVAVVGGNAELSNRMKIILKPCLYTLASHENATIYDIFEFLGDDQKAKDWVEKAKETLTNRALLDTLNIFFEKNYELTKSSVRDRLRALLSSDGLDKCLAGGKSSIDLKEAMDEGKVMVFNLAGMGQESCGAFGRFIVGTVQNIAMQRYELASHERKPVFMFLDEADRFISDAVVDIYKETRKYGLHLTIVQQTTGYKMSTETFRAIISNSCVRFSGNAGGDSQTLKDLAKNTGTTESDIRALPILSFVCQERQKKPEHFSLVCEAKGKKLGAELLGDNHSMSEEEWQEVKAFQIASYYIQTNPLEIVKTTPSENVKDTALEPLDFYSPLKLNPSNNTLNDHEKTESPQQMKDDCHSSNFKSNAFRKHFTENNAHALRVVALMVNATPKSVAFSYGSLGNHGADYWRRYLTELVNSKLLICKPIYFSETNKNGRKSGKRQGSLFAVTAEGVKRHAEYSEKPVEEFYYPKGGITSESPLMYPHRAALLEVLGLIIGLEKTLEDFEVLEIIPYFRHKNTSPENKRGVAIGRVEVKQDSGPPYKSAVLIPDAIVKIRMGDQLRLVVIELHRKTAPKEIIEALRKHAIAIESKVFIEKFEVPKLNFVLSIHTDPVRRENTLKQIKNGEFPNFNRYEKGFYFATLDELIEGGINESLYQLDGTKGRIFENFWGDTESVT